MQLVDQAITFDSERSQLLNLPLNMPDQAVIFESEWEAKGERIELCQKALNDSIIFSEAGEYLSWNLNTQVILKKIFKLKPFLS